MTSRAKGKGDRGEREAEVLLRELLGLPSIRRALGAGRADDIGDMDGVPDTCIQVAWREDISAALRTKVPQSEEQRKRRGVPFAATMLRRSRSPWLFVLTPEQWATLWRYAQFGIAVTQDRDQVKIDTRDRGKRAES